MNEGTTVPAESLPLISSEPSSDLDTEGAQLRDFAEKADTGQITQEEWDTGPTAKAADSAKEGQQRAADTETKTDKPDNSETSAEKAERERDEKGRFKAKSAEAEQKPEEQKTETDYAKAKKESERQKGVLAGFEEKKQAEWARIRAEDQRIAQERAQLQQQARQGQQPRFASNDLWQASQEFDTNAERLIQEGKNELDPAKIDQGNEQLKLARNARTAAQQSYYYEQQQAHNSQIQEHEKAWKATCAQVIEQNPELGDPANPLAQEMTKLLEQEPILGQIPDGFKKGFEILQMRKAYAEVSGLREEVTKLKQELKAERERTGLSGSGPTPHTEKRPEDLPMDEWGEQLRRQLDDSWAA